MGSCLLACKPDNFPFRQIFLPSWFVKGNYIHLSITELDISFTSPTAKHVLTIVVGLSTHKAELYQNKHHHSHTTLSVYHQKYFLVLLESQFKKECVMATFFLL